MFGRINVMALRVAVILGAIALGLLTFSWSSDTGPWPDGVTTDGRVVAFSKGSPFARESATVSYTVDGRTYERLLPDVAETGRLAVGDRYAVEYRSGDPLDARGVVANREDAQLAAVASWTAPVLFSLAVAALLVAVLGRKPFAGPRRAH